MVSEILLKHINTAAEELITSDSESFMDLGRIYGHFEKLFEEARGNDLEKVALATEASMNLLKDIMLDETINRDEVFELLKQTVSVIQHITMPGTDQSHFNFPEKLFPNALPVNKKLFKLPLHIDDKIFYDFLNDQDGVLEKIESHLLRLEKQKDKETIADLLRIFHTLKGESGIFELQDIQILCQMTEDLIDASGDNLPIESFFTIKSWLKSAFDALKKNGDVPELNDTLKSLFHFKISELLSPEHQNPAEHNEKKLFTLPATLDESIFASFLNEQDSVLEKMESNLLALEKGTDNEILAELRRIFHTLKGESAIFELNDITKLCHYSEDLISVSPEMLPIDKLLSVKDWLKEAFDALKNKEPLPALEEDFFSATALKAIAKNGPNEQYETTKLISLDSKKSITDQKSTDVQGKKAHNIVSADIDLLSDFVLEVQEHFSNIDSTLLSLERNPQDLDLINAVFRVFHTIKGVAGFLALDDMTRLAHATESLLDLARKGDLMLTGGKIDIIFQAVDHMNWLVASIGEAIAHGASSYPVNSSLDSFIKQIQNISSGTMPVSQSSPAGNKHFIASSSLSAQTGIQNETGLEKKGRSDRLPFAAIKPGIVSHAEVEETALLKEEQGKKELRGINETEALEQETPSTGTNQLQKGKIKESIKVDSENLDKLIDAIGELVITESMIRQDSELKSIASPKLLRNIAQMDKITRELQQLGMSLRMIPVRPTFQKMARVVRDLAKKSNKKIEFIISGEDTMLDKSVVDRIGDPLIHLVRNSVDHGIEPASEMRIKAGKSETAKIHLTAFHKGGTIYIEIADDGRGLNREAILEKAKERGLFREGQSLSDREIFNFILLPGFSTATKVTDFSGRGVGMDVVKRTIEDLRGNIDIISEQGKGTTFCLRLPLTLAIIDGMLIRISTERFIIPTLSIVEAVRPKKEDLTTIVNRGEMIRVRDKLIPLFRLAHLFKIGGSLQNPEEGIVIVVEDSGKMTGIFVDELLGQQSTVIKSLGASMKGLTGISGGSIMSDGRVGIIIDIAGIIKLATAVSGA